MMKHLLFFLFIFSCISGMYAQEKQVYQDTIPFRNDLGIITIPITFNGVEKEFAFDTGAQASVAFSWAKDELKRTSKKTIVTSSNGSRTKMRYYKSGTINLGSRKITNHRILSIADSDIFSCYNIDGVLGVDIMKSFNWTIDYENKWLIMYPNTTYPEEVKQMHALDFDFVNGRPLVDMEFADKKIRFLLDTGARNSDLGKNQYKLLGIDTIPKRDYLGGFYDVNGTLTKTSTSLLQMPALQSDQVTLYPILDYSEQKTKIGNTLWKGKQLFMSLKDDTLYVSDAEIKENTSTYTCGVLYENGKMQVLSIYKDSEAWKQGIRRGDIVVSVNNKQFSDFCSLNKYQRQLSKENKDIELVLENGKKIVLRKKELFINP